MTKRSFDEASASDNDEYHLLLKKTAELRDVANSLPRVAGSDDAAKRVAIDKLLESLVVLRGASRLAQTRSDNDKQVALASMTQLERVNLHLQNLIYEQRHYESEIGAARRFTFDVDALQLRSEQELLRRQPTAFDAAALATVPREREHQRMLARLAAELDERKQLHERVEQLKQRCAERRRANAELEKLLVLLNNQLKSLVTQSLSMQQLLAQPAPLAAGSAEPATSSTTAAATMNLSLVLADEREKAAALPTPLYSLFLHVRGFRDAIDGDIDAHIEGDLAAAKQLQAASLTASASASASIGAESSATAADRAVHPLAVVVQVPLDGARGSLCGIRFSWLPALQLVTAFLTHGSGGQRGQDPLVDLWPNDSGCSPNIAHKFARGAPNFAAPGDIGRPYLWAQWLAGRDYLTPATVSRDSSMALDRTDIDADDDNDKNVDASTSASAIAPPTLSSVATISQVLRKLKSRLLARAALAGHIRALKALSIVSAPAQPPRSMRASLKTWVEISLDELNTLQRTALVGGSALRGTDANGGGTGVGDANDAVVDARRAYRFALVVDGSALALDGVVEIGPNYPLSRSHIALLASSKTDEKLPANEPLLRSFEYEVARVESSADPNALLMLQLARLQSIAEIAALVMARGEAFGVGGKLCARAHRGRERRPPLDFDALAQLYDHAPHTIASN